MSHSAASHGNSGNYRCRQPEFFPEPNAKETQHRKAQVHHPHFVLKGASWLPSDQRRDFRASKNMSNKSDKAHQTNLENEEVKQNYLDYVPGSTGLFEKNNIDQ